MQLLKTTLLAALPIALAFAPAANAQLVWRVSVKMVLDENNNPATAGDLNTDAEIVAKIDTANAILSNNGPGYAPGTEQRGYLLELVDLVDGGIMRLSDLPSPPSNVRACANNPDQYCETNGDCPGSSCVHVTHWFDAPIKAEHRMALQAAAEASPAVYGWNDDAINIYILGSDGSGTAWFDEMVLLGQDLASFNTPFHEVGHFMHLYHTHSGGGPSPDCVSGWDDDVTDTLLDNCGEDCPGGCWNQDEIANGNFSLNYAQLTSAQRHQVDQVFYNLMCYRGNRDVLTPGQLDRMTDYSNSLARHVASGYTRFVDETAPGPGSGSSIYPFPTVAAGLSFANPGDIVLLRTGPYDEVMTIDQDVTLRASRGDALIGAP